MCTYEGCDKAFTRRGDLQHHVQRVHRNERPFKCTVEGCTKVGTGSVYSLVVRVAIRVEEAHGDPRRIPPHDCRARVVECLFKRNKA